MHLRGGIQCACQRQGLACIAGAAIVQGKGACHCGGIIVAMARMIRCKHWALAVSLEIYTVRHTDEALARTR
jgi:hypothetical protein